VIRAKLTWPEGAASKKSLKSVSSLPSDVSQVIRLKCDVSTRPHAESLGSLVKCLLVYEADKRMTAEQALQHPFFQIVPPPVAVEVTGGVSSMKSTPIPAAAVAAGEGDVSRVDQAVLGEGGAGAGAGGGEKQGKIVTLADPEAAAVVTLGGPAGAGGADNVLGSGGSGRQLRPRKPKPA
jgi:hypothetical protein